MNIFDKLLPKNLYHGYLIEGDIEDASLDLIKYLEQRELVNKKDPDFFYQKYESFSISDSREIKEWHSQLSFKKNGTKICLIGANFINKEAEQALLKIIEEPGDNTYFFIITPNTSILLNTIQSRTHSVKYKDEQDKETACIAQKIKNSLIGARLDLITKFIKDNKKDESSGHLRRHSYNLLGEIEKIIYQEFIKDTSNKNSIFILEEILKGKNYLNLPGSSAKMILEQIAIIL